MQKDLLHEFELCKVRSDFFPLREVLITRPADGRAWHGDVLQLILQSSHIIHYHLNEDVSVSVACESCFTEPYVSRMLLILLKRVKLGAVSTCSPDAAV